MGSTFYAYKHISDKISRYSSMKVYFYTVYIYKKEDIALQYHFYGWEIQIICISNKTMFRSYNLIFKSK